MKRILIIDPYLDTLGGGEEHILMIAKVFEDFNYKIVLAWGDKTIGKAFKNRFNLTLKTLDYISDFTQVSSFKRYALTKEFDYLLYATDGSYFFSGAKHNYIFSMYPKKELYKRNLINDLKLANFEFIANSKFTGHNIKQWVSRPIHVITPYLQEDFFKPVNNQKEKIIVSVGRFFGHLHSKRQDILVEAFEKFQKKQSDWRLVLIGGLRDEDKDYYQMIVDKTKNNKSIELMTNVPYESMIHILDKATFYWHAAGFGVDENKHLDAVEHFGITPLEGLSRGCIVFAYDAGGQKDVIETGENGYLYNTIEQLVSATQRLIRNKDMQKKIQEKGLETAGHYDYQAFKKNCKKIFDL